jgi:hypothetical protein
VQAPWPAADDVPVGQGEQAVDPAGAKLPAGQMVQVMPGRLETAPAMQVVHALAPAGESVPAAQAVQLVAPALAAKVPAAQAVQLVAPALGAKVPAAQGAQTVPLVAVHAVWAKLPAGQAAQATQIPPVVRYALAGQLVQKPARPLQVAQLASHALHTWSLVAVQTALSYWPGAQAAAQATHWPWCRYVPASQLPHTVSALLVHAAFCTAPAGQVLHATQAPAGVSHWPAGQLVHWSARPLQVAQPGAQAAHTRSAVAEHATLWYWPAGQGPEHGVQVPPARYVSSPHVEHCWSLALVHTTVVLQPVMAVQASQVSAVPLAR